MGLIPDDIVQRIKDESDIVSIISEYVSLKKSGRDFKGLCPFHQEKTASFFVSPTKDMYYCFGCQKGGNVVNFVMDYERLDYPGALRLLADKAGITIPETIEYKSDFDLIYNSISIAVEYYHGNLLNSPEGEKARKYLESRGIDKNAIVRFKMGFAPDKWDGLLNKLSSMKIQASIAESAGLAIRKEGFYDRFRNRIVIPINNISGKPVAFGARVMPGEEGPKYINSPETSIYKKSRILFGFDVAKTYIRQANTAIVVEGYFDLIALSQYEIKNVVAVSGTGFSEEQSSLLSRFCEKVVLLYDSDSAGIKAAFRACGVLYNSGIEPRILKLPEGHDPDSFIREKGAVKLSELIDSAPDVVDFINSNIKGGFADQTISRQKRIIDALAQTISVIQDSLMRDLLKKKIASKFDISEASIALTMKSDTGAKKEKNGQLADRVDKNEKIFLNILLSHPELLEECKGIVDPTMFENEMNSEILALLIKQYKESSDFSVSNLMDKIGSNGLRNRLSEIVFNQEVGSNWEMIFEDHLKKYKKIIKKRKLEELKLQISDAEKRADQETIEKLTREFHNLKLEVEANGT